MTELNQALEGIKHGKAGGSEDIPVELVKNVLFNKCNNQAQIPKE